MCPHVLGQKRRLRHHIIVYKDDEFAHCLFHPQISRGGGTSIGLGEAAHIAVRAQFIEVVIRTVAGTIRDDDYLVFVCQTAADPAVRRSHASTGQGD